MVRGQILYPLGMHDYDRKLSAYERRKINSQKIAQVQFEPKKYSPEDYEHYQYVKKRHEQFSQETEKAFKDRKPVWSVTDQRKEEELWDE